MPAFVQRQTGHAGQEASSNLSSQNHIRDLPYHPRELFHHLHTILLMDVRLNLFLKNTTLRLYKVPKESQLLLRHGDAWHIPDPVPPIPHSQ